MSIVTKVKIEIPLLNRSQVNTLVSCGVASWDDFKQRKNYDEYSFCGSEQDDFVTDFCMLQQASNYFVIEIGRDGIIIKES